MDFSGDAQEGPSGDPMISRGFLGLMMYDRPMGRDHS